MVPGLCALGFGVIAGVGLSVHGIRTALRKYRSQMVWLILGLMLGSTYAIANGPASLSSPLPPLDITSFHVPAFLLASPSCWDWNFQRSLCSRMRSRRLLHRREKACHEP